MRTLLPDIQTTEVFGPPILVVDGALTSPGIPSLARALRRAVESKAPCICLDLNLVESMDSSVAWLLVRLQQELEADSRRLILLDPSSSAQAALSQVSNDWV